MAVAGVVVATDRLFHEAATPSNEDRAASNAGKEVITGGKSQEEGNVQIDHRGDGRSVTGVIGKAAEAAGVEAGETKDGKPTVVFPDGSRATGYPESKSTGAPSIEIRTPAGKIKVKTREDQF